MTFANIPNGSQVFIDANTLVYHATADATYGAACKQLLERIARRAIEGFTSAHALGDVAHRVMTVEAITQFGWPAKGIGQRLRKHPADVQKLTRFRQAVEEVAQIGIQVLPIEGPLVSPATLLSQPYGLLTGDALIIAVMQQHHLTNIATLFRRFDHPFAGSGHHDQREGANRSRCLLMGVGPNPSTPSEALPSCPEPARP
jgi:predicted nucleic acid-binding protein